MPQPTTLIVSCASSACGENSPRGIIHKSDDINRESGGVERLEMLGGWSRATAWRGAAFGVAFRQRAPCHFVRSLDQGKSCATPKAVPARERLVTINPSSTEARCCSR
jgi:hypothetical protein